jgi:hypothetical protein
LGGKLFVALLPLALSVTACDNGTRQVISLVVLDRVELIESNMGTSARQKIVYVLAGMVVPVVECRPQKSDIDVLVLYENQALVVGRGGYTLSRRQANMFTDSGSVVTSSCWNLLKGLG